jgi:hypothetical protein
MAVVTTSAANRRIHATHPHDWAEAAATDYWANFGNIVGIPGNAIGDLDLYGWVTSGFSHTVGSAADFLSSADVGTTGGVNFDAVSDHLRSPFIFGDYAHGQMVAGILGHDPTTLSMECYGRFAANNDEEETGFGFVEAGSAVPFVKAGLMALVTSDGTNFSLESGAAADAGSTDDTAAHLFKIVVGSASIEWFIDGTSQGTLALQTDLWPVAWGASTKAATGANDPVVSWVHIWYA